MASNNFHSFLQENYSFRGFSVESFKDTGEEVIISLKRVSKECYCPKCGKKRNAEELRKRKARSVDLLKPCYIEFEQAKVRCPCGYRGNEKLDFVDRHSRYTKRFVDYVASLTRQMNAAAVARMCGLDVKIVKKIEEEYFL